MNRKIIVAGAALLLAAALAGCGNETKQSAPDPTGDHIQVNTPKQVVAMPDGFRNVVLSCDAYGDMIYVTSRGSDLAGGQNGGGLASGIFVIPGHKACAK